MALSVYTFLILLALHLVASANAFELYRFRAIIEGFKRDELLRYPKNNPELEKSLQKICNEGNGYFHWCYFKYIFKMHQQYNSKGYFDALMEGYEKVKGLKGHRVPQSESFERWMLLHAFNVKSVDEFKQKLKNQESKSLAVVTRDWKNSFFAFPKLKFPVVNGKVNPVSLGQKMDQIMDTLSSTLFEKYSRQLKRYIDSNQYNELATYMNNEVGQASKYILSSKNSEERKSWLMNQIPVYKKSFDIYNYGRNQVVAKVFTPTRAAKVCIETIQDSVPHFKNSVLPESSTYWGKFSAFTLFNSVESFIKTVDVLDQSPKTKFDIEIIYSLFTSRSDDVLEGFRSYLQQLDNLILKEHLDHISNLMKSKDRAKINDYRKGKLLEVKTEILDRFCKSGDNQKTPFVVCQLNEIETLLVAYNDLEHAVSASNTTIAMKQASSVVKLYLNRKTKNSAPLSFFDNVYKSLSYFLLFGAENSQSVKNIIEMESPEKIISISSLTSRIFVSSLAAYSRLSSKDRKLWEEFKGLYEYYDQQLSLSNLMQLQPLAESKNLNGMKLYLRNNWKGFLVDVVIVNSCDVPLFEGWLMCGLRNIVSGFRSYIAIETRSKAMTVPIEDLQNINVKTKIATIIDDQRHFELISGIENSANQIASRVGEGNQQLIQSFGTAFKKLGRYFERDSALPSATLSKQISLSRETSVQLIGELSGKITPLTNNLKAVQGTVSALQALKIVDKIAEMALKTAELVEAVANNCNPIKLLFGGTDFALVARLGFEIAILASELAALLEEAAQLASLISKVQTVSDELKLRVQQLENLQKQNNKLFAKIQTFMKKETVTEAELSEFVASFIQMYNMYSVPLTESNINDLEASTSGMIDYMCGLVDETEGVLDLGVKAAAQRQCTEARQNSAPVFSRFTEIFGELNSEFEILASLARSIVNHQSAKMLTDFAKELEVKKVEAGPVHVLEYAILTKLYMEYQLQEGAYQFCKFHEYRMGRRPSVCMDKSYFSLNEIKKLHSYLPPDSDMKKTSLVVRIPTTKKMMKGSEGEPRMIPYVNLTAIERGETVTFSLPSWNMEWLKQHGWIIFGDKKELITFVESFELYLPLVRENDGNQKTYVKATVRSGKIQPQFSGDTMKLYSLNRREQSLQYSIGDPNCVRQQEIENPYHRYAQCVKPNLSSKLCILDTGKQAANMLLPTMFTEWEISADLEKNKGYKIATPAKGIELDILAKLVVQRLTPSSKRNLRVSVDQCCKNNEYRFLNKSGQRNCAACPKGKKGGLNGYTCLA